MTFTSFPISTLPATAARVANTPSGSISATNVQDAIDELAATTFSGHGNIYLSDFGVVGDGLTDDTAAINAAFASVAGDSATVVWDVGFCKVTDTILVGSASTQTNVNIFCPNGPIRSGVKWFGSTSGIAVLFSKQKFARCIGLGIFNQVAEGTTVGLGLGGAGGGNQTSGIIFDGLFVSGFNIGVHAGSSGGAASELAFNLPIFQSCGTGFAPTDANSLDFTFICPGFDACGIGIDSSASSGFTVFGGSASQSSVADFKITSAATQVYIGGGFRSETAEVFLLGANASGGVTVERALVVDSQTDNAVTGTFDHLVLRDCTFDGAIAPTGCSRIEVIGCNLTSWDTTTKLPIFPNVATEQHLTMRCIFRDNFDASTSPALQILDHQGIIGARYDGGSSVFPFCEFCVTIFPIDRSSSTDFGADYIALSHVRHLGEGTLTGATSSTAPVTGKNLRVRTTFATASTAALTFARTLTLNSNGGPTVTATAGNFNASDVGKKLFIDDGADTGADWHGYITNYLTSTTANVYPAADPSAPGQRYPSSSGKTATVGENEPDANYLVAGLVGNVNETIWVSSVASTGFFFNSSNSASAAVVTALIVR